MLTIVLRKFHRLNPILITWSVELPLPIRFDTQAHWNA